MHPQPGFVTVEADYFAADDAEPRRVYQFVRDADGHYAEAKTVAALQEALGPEGWNQVLMGLLSIAQTGQAIEAARRRVAGAEA